MQITSCYKVLFQGFILFQTPYFDILVPTVDTVRFGYLMEKLLSAKRPVLYTGTTGVGKVSKIPHI